MAPLLFALALLAQDAPAPEAPAPEASPDGPVATAVPRKQTVAPLPIQGGPVTPPADDYGYVGWCYGALSGYVELYDRAMPEVIRIERAWPTPSTEENINQIYPAQRDEAKRNLVLFAAAMEAAEKASPSPISTQGAAAIKRGRAVWTGAVNVPKAQLAQFWMSWSPPARCEETAKSLQARSNLFGQALSYNAPDAAPVVAPVPPAEEEAGVELAAESVVPIEPAVDLAPDEAAEQVTVASTDGPAEAVDLPLVAVDRMPSGDAESDADMDATADIPLEEAGDEAGEPVADLIETPVLEAGSSGEVAAPKSEPEGAAPPAEDAPVLDAAALSAGAPFAEGATEAPATAIDDLLPIEEPAAEPVVAGPVPPAAPEQPAGPKRKRGLKDTLMGLKGPL